MCGFVAIYYKSQKQTAQINHAIEQLAKRGPDARSSILVGNMHMAHARLSIIDLSETANQPMFDTKRKYCMVFNGEIFNFQEIKKELLKQGYFFSTHSDTEVLLSAYDYYGEDMLSHLNGFFSFVIYNIEKDTVFAARDRIGIKPFLIYENEEMIVFSSEMKALTALNIPLKINKHALYHYLCFTYVPAPLSMLENVQKLEPGCCLSLSSKQLSIRRYYSPEKHVSVGKSPLFYAEAKIKLRQLLDDSVQKRLLSDVPLGCFLSGGIDSSIIASLAAKHVNKLNTFSIGFKDHAFYDETKYAEMLAKKINSNHHVFSLGNDDLKQDLFNILDYIDEPFADSSAIAVYILSKNVRQYVTVALSGDGGDELFAGYNKHYAEWMVQNKPMQNALLKVVHPFFGLLPKSRSSSWSNKFRQLDKYAKSLKNNQQERYLNLCRFNNKEMVASWIDYHEDETDQKQLNYWSRYAKSKVSVLNNFLLNDISFVLPNDMLTKVDLMSMANSLEVRVPLLDHRVVEFALSLPEAYKRSGKKGKKILLDTFSEELPPELVDRPKKGFEVPLTEWFKKDLYALIFDDLLSKDFIEQQQLFNWHAIRPLKEKLFSANPEDCHFSIWTLMVFQYWYKKHFA